MTAPSTFALDYMNNVPIAKNSNSDVAPKTKEYIKKKPKLEVLEGTGNNSNEFVLTKDKFVVAIIFLLIITVFLAGIVFMNGHATTLKYNINKLKSQNTKLENEIRLVSTRIETANSINSLSKYAMEELGLGAPSVGQYVYISQDDIIYDLANSIKNKIYN